MPSSKSIHSFSRAKDLFTGVCLGMAIVFLGSNVFVANKLSASLLLEFDFDAPTSTDDDYYNTDAAPTAARNNDMNEKYSILPRPPFSDFVHEISRMAKGKPNSISSYQRGTVIKQAPWLPNRRQCKETCCVETVAISLDQDEHQIINTNDYLDLADVALRHYPIHDEWQAHALTNQLVPEMAPCILPGTVISIENHQAPIKYFWNNIRPHITVPYILIYSGSDANSPQLYPDVLAHDELLIRMYGMNPRYRPGSPDVISKFSPFPLGLSYQHPQEKYLRPYLQLTNFTNPFLNKDRWTDDAISLDFDEDVYVNFGRDQNGFPSYERRRELWDVLCPVETVDEDSTTTSCSPKKGVRMETIYADMSRYRFGISPPGVGWDCYRTYELLLLGIIPVIEDRDPESHDLFRDLPVIHMRGLTGATSREEILHVIQEYIASGSFQNNNFEKGWKRLFMKHRRQQILHETKRIKEVVLDEKGREYYLAYQYSTPRYCSTHDLGTCEMNADSWQEGWWRTDDGKTFKKSQSAQNGERGKRKRRRVVQRRTRTGK